MKKVFFVILLGCLKLCVELCFCYFVEFQYACLFEAPCRQPSSSSPRDLPLVFPPPMPTPIISRTPSPSRERDIGPNSQILQCALAFKTKHDNRACVCLLSCMIYHESPACFTSHKRSIKNTSRMYVQNSPYGSVGIMNSIDVYTSPKVLSPKKCPA